MPKSPSTGGNCTEAQYLAEIACQQEAKVKEEVLVNRFWNTDKWKKRYQMQVVYAHRLLKKHSFKAIVNAFHKLSSKHVYSLASPLLKPQILKEEILLNQEEKRVLESKPIEVIEKPTFKLTKKKSKLDDL